MGSYAELDKVGQEVFEAVRDRKMQTLHAEDPNEWDKELGIGGKLAGVAPMFAYNIREGYMPAHMAGERNYLANPVEIHADNLGHKIGSYLAASPQDRIQILTIENSLARMHEAPHARQNRILRQTLETADMCP